MDVHRLRGALSASGLLTSLISVEFDDDEDFPADHESVAIAIASPASPASMTGMAGMNALHADAVRTLTAWSAPDAQQAGSGSGSSSCSRESPTPCGPTIRAGT